jgi:hypothetical protein
VTQFLGREYYAHGERGTPGTATATPSCTSRPPLGRWSWSDPSCAARTGRLPRGCWARGSAAQALWRRWCCRGSCAACRSATWRPRWPRRCGRRRPCRSRPWPAPASRSRPTSTPGSCMTFGCIPALGRAGALRLGYHHPGRADAGRAGTWGQRGPRPWASFLEDLVDRGLRAPLLPITDGAAG